MGAKNWLAEVIDHEVASHWDKAHLIVRHVRQEAGTDDPDLLCNAVIDNKARIAAFIGVGTGALQAIPAVGQAVAIGTVIPEALYLAKMQIDIALVISLLYRANVTPSEAHAIITTCLILGLGADFIKNELRLGAIKVTSKAIEAAIEKIGEKALLALLEKIGIQATKEGILKKVPIISIPLNAVMNYGQIQAFGWAVKKFLSPSFVLCGNCGNQTGRLNKFCPSCGASFQ